LNASLSNSKHKSYLCVLPATYLSDLYHVYGQRLLQSNVRSFLEFRGLSNKGMRMTLLEEPENFFVYNNGITVTASSHQTKMVGKQLVITELENMQIVNGGQTTAVIYFAPKEPRGPFSKEGTNALWSDIDLKKVSVQMKLTILEDLEEAPAMTANISRFSNTQAAVTKADLESNHPMHLRIEKISRRTSVTGVDGIPRKWFYERSRGQYTIQLRAKRTAAQKNNFTAQYPKKHKFVKTDMAKYENTWRLRPDQVSEGAQKNLHVLGEKLKKEWEQNENNFRESFYQDLIAKAILFKSVDKAINTAEWYKASRGYKAQAVTYTIAMLRHLLHKQNKEINLNRIYSNQKLSEAFLSQTLDLARFVRHHLMDDEFRDGNANISQFAKKKIAWEKMQELDYDDLMIPDEDLLNTQQQKDQAYQTKALGKAGAYVGVSERILQVSQDEWAALIEYLKDDEKLPFNDRKVNSVRLCIYLHQGKKVPQPHQAKEALEIRDWAMGRDFSFFEG